VIPPAEPAEAPLPPAPPAPRGWSPTTKVGLAVGSLLGFGVLSGMVLFVMLPGALWPLQAQALPGFQIDLPRGTVDRAAAAAYTSGHAKVEAAKGWFSVRVSWRPGSPMDEEDGAGVARGLAAMLGVSAREVERGVVVEVPGARSSLSLKIVQTGKKPMWMTVASCAARSITIMTTGTVGGVERLHRRVARTVRCQPDPTGEAGLGDVPAILALPPGWHRVGGYEQLAVTDGRYVMMAGALGETISETQAQIVLSASVEPDMRLGEPQGTDWPVEAKKDTTRGWVTLRRCPEVKQVLLVMALFEAPNGDSRTARELLGKARCRRPGEPPQRWPEAPAAAAGSMPP
jgi:hypothetical protein